MFAQFTQQVDEDYRDFNRPTCKVVKVAGRSGTRIYPRGCKVRNVIQSAQGAGYRQISQFTKEGQRKARIEYRFDRPSGYQPRILIGTDNRISRATMVWDTGNSVPMIISSTETLDKILGNNWRIRANVRRDTIGGVGGGGQRCVIFEDVDFYVYPFIQTGDVRRASIATMNNLTDLTKRNYKVTADIWVPVRNYDRPYQVGPYNSNLLGLPVIKQLPLNVKFKFSSGLSVPPDGSANNPLTV